MKIVLTDNFKNNSITIQIEGEYKPKDVYRALDFLIMYILLDDSMDRYEKNLYIDGIAYEKIIHDISIPRRAHYKYRFIDNEFKDVKEDESYKIQSTLMYDNGFNISNINFIVIDSFLHSYIHEISYISGDEMGTKKDGFNIEMIEYFKLLQQRIYECLEKNFTDDFIAQLNIE